MQGRNHVVLKLEKDRVHEGLSATCFESLRAQVEWEAMKVLRLAAYELLQSLK